MTPAQQEALNNYNALSAYFSGMASYGTQNSTTLPYFPDIVSGFSHAQTMSDLFQAAQYQSNYALGSRVSYVTSIQALLRESSIRSQGKGTYALQQAYVGTNDANYYSYKAYADVYQFTGNSDRFLGSST